jgi:hypothetical protein
MVQCGWAGVSLRLLCVGVLIGFMGQTSRRQVVHLFDEEPVLIHPDAALFTENHRKSLGPWHKG